MYTDLETLQHLVALHRMWSAVCFGTAICGLIATGIWGALYGCSCEYGCNAENREQWRKLAKCFLGTAVVLGFASLVSGAIGAYYPSTDEMDAAIRLKQVETLKDSAGSTYILEGPKKYQ